MKNTFSLLVKNDPGVLMDVILIFKDKQCNIDSLAVGVTENSEISRITIVSEDYDTDEIIRHLCSNPAVIKAKLLSPGAFISRSHVLIKVCASMDERCQIVQIADIFRAKIVDISPESATIEITGDDSKVNALINMLSDFGIVEIARAGSVAIERGIVQL